MKTHSLSVFCIFLILSSMTYVLCSRIKISSNAPLRGYFFIQRYYPGSDPIDNIKESEFHTRQMFFELNKEILFFARSLERIEDVEGKLKLIK